MLFEKTEYLSLRHELRFRPDGGFRILILTDPHGGTGCHPQLKKGIDAIIAAAQPDLVLFGGDLTGCHIGCRTEEELWDYLALITEVPEKRKIPWAHVYGNHDANLGISNARQQRVFQSFPMCISKPGPDEIDGVGNYVLPVLNRSGEPAFNIWGLDTHNDNACFCAEYGLPLDTKIILPEHTQMGYWSDSIRTNQLIWYWQTSEAIEKEFGRKIPGMMYMHIPLPEFCLIPRNPLETHMTGVMREHVGTNELNPGLFAACLQRGDIRAIFAGHDHLNDFCGDYCGIILGQCAGINYDCGSCDDLRGGRVVEIHEDDPSKINTYMLRLRDILGADADNHLKR